MELWVIKIHRHDETRETYECGITHGSVKCVLGGGEVEGGKRTDTGLCIVIVLHRGRSERKRRTHSRAEEGWWLCGRSVDYADEHQSVVRGSGCEMSGKWPS
ncbi:hypothetical protein HNY73_013046 [Argiope bruennichi]|uniref:Uncharacterized protein n=1 Tax=Argiope bruennichi TaxID=94029 RepID=A0A8T0F1M3_ARGBR|nr:hypothetical protein HNY73_013046 [Argiope bruennichi]